MKLYKEIIETTRLYIKKIISYRSYKSKKNYEIK